MEKIAMQMRCIFCGKEQYAPAVFDISHGKRPCCWCGKTPNQMTVDEYSKVMSAMRSSQK